MAKRSRWIKRETPWLTHYDLSSSSYLPELIEAELVDLPTLVWRGQRCADWKLEPTLARKFREVGRPLTQSAAKALLEEFKFAARGRLQSVPASENEWWALGQHHGLATPLLDWTTSPFVAAYFAYVGSGRRQTNARAIWGLSRSGIMECSKLISEEWKGRSAATPAPIVEIVRSYFGDNRRLLSQSGLFTKAPDGLDLESWYRRYAPQSVLGWMLMVKITVPNADRECCLRMLDRMNINHLTLFPDLDGSARYCNTFLEIDRYH